MDQNLALLKAIKARKSRQNRFGAGIATADQYVKTLSQCVGSALCRRYAQAKGVEFNDVLKKAAQTLVYNNQDMVLEEKLGLDYARIDKDGDEIQLPKNTLMVFRHVLTTPRKDRDGDVLRTEGAVPDPKMLLLWQHTHTLPIGKVLQVVEHTKKKLSLVTAIIDLNELAHDAAVMIDNDMGRFSHGFRALEFSEMKAEVGSTTSPGGYDVKQFEIMEASLVSVPSNTDAQVEEVLVDLVEGGKLKSDIMRKMGKAAWEKRPVTIPVKIDLNLKVNGKDVNNGGEEKNLEKECTCQGDERSPKEANDGDAEKGGTQEPQVKQVALSTKYGGTGFDGSWEQITELLREQVRELASASGLPVGNQVYVYIVATYPSSVVWCVDDMGGESTYFSCMWRMNGDQPELVGEPMEVEIETNVVPVAKVVNAAKTKAGKVLNSKNMQLIKESHDELLGMQKDEVLISKSAKTRCQNCVQKLASVLESGSKITEEEEGKSAAKPDIKSAMATFLAEADIEQRMTMQGALQVMASAEQKSRRAKRFLSLVGR